MAEYPALTLLDRVRFLLLQPSAHRDVHMLDQAAPI